MDGPLLSLQVLLVLLAPNNFLIMWSLFFLIKVMLYQLIIERMQHIQITYITKNRKQKSPVLTQLAL